MHWKSSRGGKAVLGGENMEMLRGRALTDRRGLLLSALVGSALIFGATGVVAQPADEALGGLSDCAALAEPAAKSACYDAAYAALDQQVRSGEISIVRRKEAQAAQRGAFGFNLPSQSLFERAAGDEGPLESIVSEVGKAHRDPLDRWVVELRDGGVWRQLDNEAISPPPRAGTRVEIRRAALGSFIMKVGSARGVRAKRSE